VQKIRQFIPWAMAAGRALLGPVVLFGECCGWSGATLAAMVVAALLSDIFDGVLARRWHVDTAAVRLCDSMCDTVFYACVVIALWPRIWSFQKGWLIALLLLEAANIVFALAKFRRPVSYHSYLAKAWGLVLATAVIATLVSPSAGVMMRLALLMGIASNLETMAMSLMLPIWYRDVKTPRVAWRIRQRLYGKPMSRPQEQRIPVLRTPTTQQATRIAVLVVAVVSLAIPSVASAQAPKAVYYGGTAGLAVNTEGSFDTASPTALQFNYRRPDGAVGQLAMTYDAIRGVEPHTEQVHHLGALPFIAISLVAHPLERHLIIINYADANGLAQVAVFEVAKRDQAVLVSVVNARSPRGCSADRAPCTRTLVKR